VEGQINTASANKSHSTAQPKLSQKPKLCWGGGVGPTPVTGKTKGAGAAGYWTGAPLAVAWKQQIGNGNVSMNLNLHREVASRCRYQKIILRSDSGV
jgi:hypothetical protein